MAANWLELHPAARFICQPIRERPDCRLRMPQWRHGLPLLHPPMEPDWWSVRVDAPGLTVRFASRLIQDSPGPKPPLRLAIGLQYPPQRTEQSWRLWMGVAHRVPMVAPFISQPIRASTGHRLRPPAISAGLAYPPVRMEVNWWRDASLKPCTAMAFTLGSPVWFIHRSTRVPPGFQTIFPPVLGLQSLPRRMAANWCW